MEIPATLLRPFTSDELADVPEPWSVGPPDFVGAGCGKAGSSWWYRLLVTHPRIVQNRLRKKELHYFPHFGSRRPAESDLELYRTAFARPRGSVCGEWSGNYLYYPFALDSLYEAAPDTKLIVLLRNPVDRFVSCLNHYLTARANLVGSDGDGRSILETWSLFPEAAYQCRVADGVRRALRLFGAERVLLLQYERCKAEPEVQLARTYAFLGVDPAFEPEGLTRPINRREHTCAPPDIDERARIARWFEDDVRALCELVPSLEIERWSEFAATAVAS